MARERTEAVAAVGLASKLGAVRSVIEAVERQFGRGALMLLGEAPEPAPVAVIPTGSLGLDLALGVGGVPRGRIVEVYGPEASGKTTLALHVVAAAQAAGGVAAFVDAEHALDVRYAAQLGVRVPELLVSQPDTGEQALEITEALVRSSAIEVVVVDSVAALVPRAELEGEMGDSHVGLQARLMSQALRKLTGAAHKHNTTILFINQTRQKIGVMFGSPETTTGGMALKFYASMRLDIRRIGALKNGEAVIGNRTRVKIVKNKLAPPFREVEFDILYGQGISGLGELIDLCLANGVLDKSGSWLSWGERRLGQGRDKVRELLAGEPELAVALRSAVLAKAGTGAPLIATPAEEAELAAAA